MMTDEYVLRETRAGSGAGGMKILLSSILIAVLGGICKLARNRGRFTFAVFFSAGLTSAFIGMQMHFFCRYFQVTSDLQFALVGFAGYGSGALLDAAAPLMVRWAYKRLGLEYPEPRRRRNDD